MKKILSEIKECGQVGVYVTNEFNGERTVLTQLHAFSGYIPEIVIFSPTENEKYLKGLHYMRMKNIKCTPTCLSVKNFIELFKKENVIFGYVSQKKNKFLTKDWFQEFFLGKYSDDMGWLTITDFRKIDD